jgi:hypothetical protein
MEINMMKIAIIPALLFSGYILSCHKDEEQSKKTDSYSCLSEQSASSLMVLRGKNLDELDTAEQSQDIQLLREAWSTVFGPSLAKLLVSNSGPSLARINELLRREMLVNTDIGIFKALIQRIGLKNFVQCFLYLDWLLKNQSFFTAEAEAEGKFGPELEAQLIKAFKDRFNVDISNEAEFKKLESDALDAMLEMQQGLRIEFKSSISICSVS